MLALSRACLVALVMSSLVPFVCAAEPDAAGRAREFVVALFEGEFGSQAERMTEAVRSAMTPEVAAGLAAQLIEGNGEVLEIGTAWKEDEIQGLHRWRVPVSFERTRLDLRIVLDGEHRVAGLFVVPHRDPPGPEPDGPPAGREIEVNVGQGEDALPGTLTLPDGSGPHPGIVLVHGSGPQDRDETVGPNKPFRDLAWGLAARGIAVLRYDKRSLARPQSLMALGSGLTVQHEVIDDARAALQWLREHDEVDGDRLFVLGHSLGGSVAPRIAEAAPRPAGIIVMAGATLPLPEKMLAQFRYIHELDGVISPTEASQMQAIEAEVKALRAAIDADGPPSAETLLGAPVGYYRDLEQRDAPALAARLGLPILVLQGERDYQVTTEDFALWRRALDDKPFACLRLLKGLDHLFHDGTGPSTPAQYEIEAAVAPVALSTIAGWVNESRCAR